VTGRSSSLLAIKKSPFDSDGKGDVDAEGHQDVVDGVHVLGERPAHIDNFSH
jgi:hypothetical protein